MNGIHATKWGNGLARRCALALVLGLGLARLGPFGTFSELAALPRSSYWIGLTLLLWAQIEVGLTLLALRDDARSERSLGRAVLAGLFGSLPTAFEVAWAESLLRVTRDLGALDLLAISGDVALIAVPFAIVLEWLRGERRSGNRVQQGPSVKSADLQAAMPIDRRGEPIAVAAEDHYVRIYTQRGETLVNRRFAEALDSVSAVPGLQVHRSWWIAIGAVEKAERDGDRVTLVLANGLNVPVSRTYLMAARNAGVLPR